MVFMVFNLAPIRTPKSAGKWFYVLGGLHYGIDSYLWLDAVEQSLTKL